MKADTQAQSLDSLRNAVDEFLQRYAETELGGPLAEPVEYIIRAGGKRIRPVLCMLACSALGGNPSDALAAASALEVLHNFTLVHDDIMDKSELRRGRPTVHIKWNTPVAILTGDIMLGIAYKMLLESACKGQNGRQVLEAFTQGLIEVCEGQALDLDFESREPVYLEEYLLMIEKKTARLLEMAAVIGAHLGNGTSEQVEHFRLYARSLGLAFQIQDDLLDLIGNQKDFGKTSGQDVEEGKKTFMIVHVRESITDSADRELFDRFVRAKGLDRSEVPAMRELLVRLGATEAAAAYTRRYTEEALYHLRSIPPSMARDLLEQFTQRLLLRST